MANKLVQQQLKNILRGLNDHDLDKLLTNYEMLASVQIEKACRTVSYKCYEATMKHKSWTASGYGRTEIEASNNCVKNFLEMVMEDEVGLSLLVKALKKSNEPAGPTRQSRDNPEKTPNANNTLALNGSYTHGQENNSSFDTRKDLEILSKNIGNISVIGNMKHNSENHNASQFEMDDMLLKMLDDAAQAGGGVNNFRKSLPPQHPNGLDLGNKDPAGVVKSYGTIYKADRGERGSSLTRNSVGSEESEAAKNKKVLQENTNLYNNNKGSSVGSNDKDENRYDSRHDNKMPPSHFKYKNSSSYKELEQKHLHQQYQQSSHASIHNQRPGSVEPSHKEFRRDSREHERSSTKCLCNCSEQLQRANLRIESLEKKLKLLAEENKILKYLTSENKDKELKSDLSTMTSTNAPTKSTYEKSIGNYDLTPHENCDDVNEFPDKGANGQTDNKSRSLSLDAYARRKTFMEPHYNQKSPHHISKEMNESMEKKDVKKMIPRLKLEMIPNYHAKYNNTSNPAINQNPTVVAATKGYTQQAIQNPSSNFMYSQNSFESGLGTGSSSLSKYIKK